MDADAYCREIEAHLCRRNEGHLVRIVGPSFEMVTGWAERGIPLKIALQGIDRCVDRYLAKGPRRRPARIDFCEADVLDAFDRWRRAVGVPERFEQEGAESGESAESGSGRAGRSLPSHLDRVITRLTGCRAGGRVAEALDREIERTVRELDASRAGARGLRGEARVAFVRRLEELDRALVDAAVASAEEGTLDQLGRDAARTLEPFRERMPGEAFAAAVAREVRRQLRERLSLPSVAFE